MGSLYRRKQKIRGTVREVVVHSNDGLRKLCACSRRNWAKCAHPWHFNFKPAGGPSYRFSLDTELGRHVKLKEDPEAEAEKIRIQIRET